MPPLIEEVSGRTEESTRANTVRPYRVVSHIAIRKTKTAKPSLTNRREYGTIKTVKNVKREHRCDVPSFYL